MDLDQTFGNLFRGADQGISSVPHRHSVTDKRQGVVRNRLRMSKLHAYELVDRFVVDHITHELRDVGSRLLPCRPAHTMTACSHIVRLSGLGSQLFQDRDLPLRARYSDYGVERKG